MTVLHIHDRAEAFNARAQLAGWTVECDKSLSFKRPELVEFCALWKEKAKPFGIPPRSAFDVRTLKPYLRNITLVERLADPMRKWRYRMRIYSSALAQITGGDKTGRYLDEFCAPHFMDLWTECYETIFDGGRPLRFVNHYQMEPVTYLTGESFSAPMGNDPANPNMILSCTYLGPRGSDGS